MLSFSDYYATALFKVKFAVFVSCIVIKGVYAWRFGKKMTVYHSSSIFKIVSP